MNALQKSLGSQRVIPVLRLPSASLTELAVSILQEAGFETVEITMTTPDAFNLLRKTRNAGAGTVLDLETAQRCLDAGARFLVSPCLVPGLARLAHQAGKLALIGGFTPGEILNAHKEGADVVKVFPASTGGPDHVRAIRAIYPDIPLCPTGGISLTNIKAYFDAGAAYVGVGNNIIDQKALAAGDRQAVMKHARRFLE